MPAPVDALPPGDNVRPGGIAIGQFLVVLAQLGLLTLVLRQFQIESGAFLRLSLLTFAGFAVHAFLPEAHWMNVRVSGRRSQSRSTPANDP
jgi:hypothetical protein